MKTFFARLPSVLVSDFDPLFACRWLVYSGPHIPCCCFLGFLSSECIDQVDLNQLGYALCFCAWWCPAEPSLGAFGAGVVECWGLVAGSIALLQRD
ncbi:hypothetical protein MRB53_001947 [Persea americana]|uniref:Uncharacterized protein n=1 Tax=Persea americana TaxID=3435 RepID=A0ACC2MT93_PERAE|nr:hypothetical protein MRB53_001947 [Persea americana]